ncbi:MAG TPA: GNAT family N-acetyltransferase [Candidatus Dormibacteraeota bacterium]|nr:GNAT family N-acetyltransferase [Candidatus Dormibacteraeota bacterium]
MKQPHKSVLVIRRARSSDAARIAELSGELGYLATAKEISQRMRKLRAGAANALFVAEAPDSGIVGWTHVSVTHLVETGTRAELNGLVVTDGQRSLGAGARLLAAAEAWARKHGCPSMSVRSNVVRERAHAFYEREGYEHYKTQKAFRKDL